MNVKRALLFLVLGVFIGISVQVAAAKGGDMVTISGSTLAHEVVVTDNMCVLNAFSDTNLEDLTTQLDQAPTDLGDSFLMTRYTKLMDGSYELFDQIRYYTDPAGGLGYVNYLGMAYGPTAYDGAWFRPTAQTDLVIKSLIGQTPAGTPARATISSPSLPHDIEITTDLCTLSALAMGNLEDPTMRVNRAPHVQGDGYLITRYIQTASGDQPYDQVRFYRDPAGGRGYVYDLGRVDGGASDSARQWFRPTANSEYVMENILLDPSGYVGNP